MLKRRKNEITITAEKVALLAEIGLKAARLSKAEKLALAEGGLTEVYTIREGLKSPAAPLDAWLIDAVMAKHFSTVTSAVPATPTAIMVRFTKKTIEIIDAAFDWQPISPAFAVRGPEAGGVSFSKEAGKLTVHLELVKTGERRACINVRLTDESKRERSSFEATLFKGDRCVESMNVTESPVASFSNIALGDYLLKVSDKKGEIASVVIRMGQ